MANAYYTFSTPFIPGTRARSEDVNAQLEALETAFDLLPTSTRSIIAGTSFLGIESGSGNAYVVTMTDTRGAYQEGDRILFKATHTNTAAGTLNVDGGGPSDLVNLDGSALIAGDVTTDLYYHAVHNAVSGKWQLLHASTSLLSGGALYVAYAQEWATKAEDSLVSTAAGGDGVSDYSALHWAAKASASASAAASSESNASTSETNAATSASNAAASEAAAAASAASIALPAFAGGSLQFLRVNAGETAWELAPISVTSATTTAEGVVELATQAEVDAGTDTARVVTPDTLANWAGRYTLPAASETVVGGAELATQAEVDAGDATRIVTGATLAGWSGLYVLPAASSTVVGGIELATQAEVDAGTDATRAVTPDTLANWAGLPTAPGSATTTAEGLIELATQGEVNAGTDAVRAVTPSTLANWTGLPGSATAGQEGLIELATQAEVDAGTDTVRAITPSTLAAYSGLGGAYVQKVAKSADTSRASTTTAVADTHLVLSSVSGYNSYLITGCLAFTCASSIPHIKLTLAATATNLTYGAWGANNATGASTTTRGVSDVVNTTSNVVHSGGTISLLHFSAVVRYTDTAAKNFSIDWAQNMSNANALVLKAGSWLRVEGV